MCQGQNKRKGNKKDGLLKVSKKKQQSSVAPTKPESH